MILPGGAGRAYLRTAFGRAAAPYFDAVHFDIHDESWYTQYALRDRMAADARFHGRVYAGCAGAMNLDYIAATRAPAAVLFDINPAQRVFWGEFTKRLARQKDRAAFAAALPRFAGDLFYKLRDVFGPAGLCRDARAPVPEAGEDSYRLRIPPEERYSPFRGMRYERVARWAQSRAEDPQHWLGSDEKYAHLHALARARAIAAVTLDIRDREACDAVAATLARADVAVGLLYRSNVGHYLKWSAAEIAEHKEKGEIASDFSRLPVTARTYRQAHDNLRRWMAADAHMIAADRHTGGTWGQFVPRLRPIKGLAVAPAAG